MLDSFTPYQKCKDGESVSFIFSGRQHKTTDQRRTQFLIFSPAMEDSHAAVLDLDEGKPENETNTFFAVYDGHGGESSSTLYLKFN